MFNLNLIFMKKLYIVGIISVSLLTYSCSNDEESYEVQGVKTKDLKSAPQSILESELTTKAVDSTVIDVEMGVEGSEGSEGDPSNPRPPR
jgi:hypothetical protein